MPRRMSSRLAPTALLCLLAAGSARAQEPAIIAIRAGRLVDVDKGEVRRDQVILIRGDRITAVQPGSARLPAGELSAAAGSVLRWRHPRTLRVACGRQRLP